MDLSDLVTILECYIESDSALISQILQDHQQTDKQKLDSSNYVFHQQTRIIF